MAAICLSAPHWMPSVQPARRPEISSRRLTAWANLSPSTLRHCGGVDDGAVDGVEATSSFFEQDSRPIMLFDGICNLCNGGVKFVRDNDRNKTIRYETLQSENGRKLLRISGRAPDDISSLVLVERDRSYVKSEAVLKIMEYINIPFPQLAFFLRFVPLSLYATMHMIILQIIVMPFSVAQSLVKYSLKSL